jgi:TonB family protein
MPSRASVGCLDTLHAADSVWRVVKLSVAAQDTAQKLPHDFEGFFAQEFRRRFKVPAKLPLSVVMGSRPCDSVGLRCYGGYLDLATIAYATAHFDGTLSGIEVIDATLIPTLAESVHATLDAMSKDGMAPTSTEDSLPVIIRLETEENPDTVPELRHVFRAKIPHYAVPFRYATMPTSGIEPRYPFNARLAGVGDSVKIAFTIDTEGRIAAESLELVRATYGDFVSSVLNALQRTRYHPARLGDCPVSTRTSQRFVFRPPED